MSSIKYRNFEGHTVREIHNPGEEPYYVLEDIAKALGMTLEEATALCQNPVELKDVVTPIDFSDTKR
jgi:prophage antirepressor-like protein